ncbi:immunoglobulin superfamily member 1-like, partial [Chanos chanos]|uniref:immunoglobulin superfamily member 1-like n=1 Tax=Chanos chanos TaxID=29144 RepID=UPI0011F2EE8C
MNESDTFMYFPLLLSIIYTDLSTATLTVKPESPVYTGETVILKCTMESGRNWRYKWYKGNTQTAVSQSNGYTITGDTLTIRAVAVTDQDQYWCQGESDDRLTSSQLSSPVTLTVREKPRAVLQSDPDVSVIYIGQPVTLKCDIPGGRVSEWIYSWYKNNNIIRPVYWSDNNELSFISNELHVGRYTCGGKRKSDSLNSEMSNAVTLTVLALPTTTVIVQPKSPVYTGETVTLKCVVQFKKSDWRYKWHKGGIENEVVPSGRYAITGDTFTIKGAALSDQDQYRYSPTATLTVKPETTVYTGETVTLKCEIKTESGWRYKW